VNGVLLLRKGKKVFKVVKKSIYLDKQYAWN
jgi:hypothetical protein